jgi:hypothetical protein
MIKCKGVAALFLPPPPHLLELVRHVPRLQLSLHGVEDNPCFILRHPRQVLVYPQRVGGEGRDELVRVHVDEPGGRGEGERQRREGMADGQGESSYKRMPYALD